MTTNVRFFTLHIYWWRN